jgi:hypothetical protein
VVSTNQNHVVLLGDSIFDNASYVPGRPAVIEQLRGQLPNDWRATLLAVDGALAGDVEGQLSDLPDGATHLVVSAGGNDALGASQLLRDVENSAAEGFSRMANAQMHFRQAYREMLNALIKTGRRVVACTVYDRCPELPAAAIAGLSVFNDAILGECFRRTLPVIDLRLICDSADDYSELSPIEPSEIGGAKIARAIKRTLLRHTFSEAETVVYGAA